MRLGTLISGLVATLAMSAVLPAPAAALRPDALPITRVQDLHYGDVLFELYKEEDFEALTRLEAYKHWGLLAHHGPEAELLAGGLYLQLGMHNEAGRRFETLLGTNIPAGVRNRAWFYLAKVWYARGYFDKTVESIAKIAGALPTALEPEKQHLWANALMRLQRYDEAIRLLDGWKGSGEWMAYAQFNLGVALVRSNRLTEADRFLTAAGTLDSNREELLALRDKANLALGFAYLQANQPAQAKPSLERVRLNGPQSNKALLGMGWANASLEQYQDALTPWLALRDRNLLDAAVQEAYLAVPYAFGKLGANNQAAEYYELALKSFGEETARIDTSIEKIRGGALLASLLEGDADERRGWFWQLKQLPDAPESRYLYPILAGNDFQEGLKNYRDMAYLGSTLARWDENMVIYADMTDSREHAYAERTPRVDALLGSDAVTQLDARRATVEARYNDVINRNDFAALGTAQERAQWRRIQELEDAIAADPGNAELAGLKDKLRLVRGVLYWNLHQAYRGRLYNEKREIAQLDQAIAEAHNRWLRVENARKSAPSTTGDFAVRIAALQQRLTGLRATLAKASEAQSQLLSQLAIAELNAQKERIAAYEVQARFSLASIYDRAAEPPR